MAIQRERMISIINAAMAYRALILQLRHQLHQDLTSGTPVSLETRLSMLDYAIVETDGAHNGVLSTEVFRFNANEGRNRREKDRARRKRESQGITPRQHYPLPINATTQVAVPQFISPDPQKTHRYEVEATFNKEFAESRPDLEPVPLANTVSEYLEEEEKSRINALKQHQAPRRSVIGEEDKLPPLDPEDED